MSAVQRAQISQVIGQNEAVLKLAKPNTTLPWLTAGVRDSPGIGASPVLACMAEFAQQLRQQSGGFRQTLHRILFTRAAPYKIVSTILA